MSWSITRLRAGNRSLVAVDAPVPGFARQVVEAEPTGVGAQPRVTATATTQDLAAGGEVDGEALLVHRRAGTRRRRMTLRRRHLVDRVAARSAVRAAQRDLLARVAVARTAERDPVRVRCREERGELPCDARVDHDPADRRQRHTRVAWDERAGGRTNTRGSDLRGQRGLASRDVSGQALVEPRERRGLRERGVESPVDVRRERLLLRTRLLCP